MSNDKELAGRALRMAVAADIGNDVRKLLMDCSRALAQGEPGEAVASAVTPADFVRLPSNVAQAKAMVKVGTMWLKQHPPTLRPEPGRGVRHQGFRPSHRT